jgi:DNA-binding NarL/FixJ family response regulator
VLRLLIANEDPAFRTGLRVLLDERPDLEIVAEAADGREAISKAIETKPDVAIISHPLPLVDGLEVTKQLRGRLRGIRILIVAGDESETYIAAPFKAGARGYLLSKEVPRYLIEAIDTVASQKRFFTPNITEALLASFLADPRRGP